MNKKGRRIDNLAYYTAIDESTPVYALKNSTATAKTTLVNKRILSDFCLISFSIPLILSNIALLKIAIIAIRINRMCLIDNRIEYVFSKDKNPLVSVESLVSNNPVTRRPIIDT